jgi:hypothetical protein
LTDVDDYILEANQQADGVACPIHYPPMPS